MDSVGLPLPVIVVSTFSTFPIPCFPFPNTTCGLLLLNTHILINARILINAHSM